MIRSQVRCELAHTQIAEVFIFQSGDSLHLECFDSFLPVFLVVDVDAKNLFNYILESQHANNNDGLDSLEFFGAGRGNLLTGGKVGVKFVAEITHQRGSVTVFAHYGHVRVTFLESLSYLCQVGITG